jgi:hypothetical protein
MLTSSSFEKAISFIETIGIPVHFRSFGEDSFLPGTAIENGALIIDMQKLKYPGDILHEAAHIAVVPADERMTLNADRIAERPDREAEEMMAIAWSYAACVHLDIDASFVFHEHGYQAGGSNILENFRQGRFFGVPMLQWVGLTKEKKKEPDDIVYPQMSQWLRN